MTCWEHLDLNDVLQEINFREIRLTVALRLCKADLMGLMFIPQLAFEALNAQKSNIQQLSVTIKLNVSSLRSGSSAKRPKSI